MTTIFVTLLGTTASIPTKKRNHPAIYLSYQSENEHSFLFDCGEATQNQIFKAGLNFMRINHIFITHWHADHFAGLLGLLETMNLEKRKKPLYIYGPETEVFVEKLLEIGYWHKNFEIIPKNVPFEGTNITTVFDNNEFEIVSIPVKHGIPAVAYGFFEKDRLKIDKKKAVAFGLPNKGHIFRKIKDNGSAFYKGRTIKAEDVCFTEKGKKVVYSGDTRPCSNLEKIAKDSDLLIQDATYFETIDRNHGTLQGIIKMASRTNAKKIILTHISRRYQNQKELEDLIKDYKQMRIAKDFMRIKLR